MICSKCGKGEMRHYDFVWRIIRKRNGKNSQVKISRNKCTFCGAVLRDVPDIFIGKKQYEASIIRGVVDGSIDEETIGYEDYPCEMTMKRWRKEFH